MPVSLLVIPIAPFPVHFIVLMKVGRSVLPIMSEVLIKVALVCGSHFSGDPSGKNSRINLNRVEVCCEDVHKKFQSRRSTRLSLGGFIFRHCEEASTLYTVRPSMIPSHQLFSLGK
jgi:hypothetical protein